MCLFVWLINLVWFSQEFWCIIIWVIEIVLRQLSQVIRFPIYFIHMQTVNTQMNLRYANSKYSNEPAICKQQILKWTQQILKWTCDMQTANTQMNRHVAGSFEYLLFANHTTQMNLRYANSKYSNKPAYRRFIWDLLFAYSLARAFAVFAHKVQVRMQFKAPVV